MILAQSFAVIKLKFGACIELPEIKSSLVSKNSLGFPPIFTKPIFRSSLPSGSKLSLFSKRVIDFSYSKYC